MSISDKEFLNLLSDAKFSDEDTRNILDEHMKKKLQEAENGDVEAMRFYARHYAECYLPDFGEVEIYWYKKIVELTEDVYLMNYIGEFCEYRGSPEDNDVAESIKYLNMAIERGDFRSMYAMAWNYYHGVNTREMEYYHDQGFEVDEVIIPEDKEKAWEYFMRAAEGGYGEAMSTLAEFYAEGTVVEKDLEKSLYWFQKAVEAGSTEAAEKIGDMFHDGEIFEKNLSEAVEWYKKGAKLDSLSCSYKLGLMYSRGDVVEPDEYEAEKYFLQAANNTSAFLNREVSLRWYGERSSAKNELAKIYLSRVRKLLFPITFLDFNPLGTPEEKNILNFSLELLKNGNKSEVENLAFYFLELARMLFEKAEEKKSDFGGLDAFVQSRTESVQKRFGTNREKNFEDLENFLKYILEISVENGDTEIKKLIEETQKIFESKEK